MRPTRPGFGGSKPSGSRCGACSRQMGGHVLGRGIHHPDVTDDDRRHGLVAVGVATDDRCVVGVLPDVVVDGLGSRPCRGHGAASSRSHSRGASRNGRRRASSCRPSAFDDAGETLERRGHVGRMPLGIAGELDPLAHPWRAGRPVEALGDLGVRDRRPRPARVRSANDARRGAPMRSGGLPRTP